MVDISSQNNKINVTVSSSGNTANTNVTPDYALYYSEKSKEWAISNKIVDNIDYSSKYYANESKKQADISTAKTAEVIESGNTAVSNVESARDNAITDVNTAGATQVALATEQATIATNKANEVIASGNEALANIDTAKNNAITSITNQETTSKTVLIDEGATQIGLIQNEGATQVANVQSTGFYMRDDKLYFINSQGEETEFKSGGSGLELCDIGMALYVDETKGLRRYLNGQIVDINANTQLFLNRLKEITTLHPSLLCTENEWQTAKTMSAFGQVGKFVFNYSGEDIVSVRLPRVVNVQGLFDLQNLGMTVSAGLPNITGSQKTFVDIGRSAGNGALYRIDDGSDYVGTTINQATRYNELGFDASRSNPIYGNSSTVQPEAIQYPYFIQIATGSETENNIINDIELNNPYSLFDSKYSDHELNNLSWLKSEGQWNSKAVYPDAYDKILENVNNCVKGFLGQTMYMWGSASGGYMTTSLTPVVGSVVYSYGSKKLVGYLTEVDLTIPAVSIRDDVGGVSYTNVLRYTPNDESSSAYITDYDFVLNTADETFRLPLKTLHSDDTVDSLSLYFYVGETVQNANLINAGRIGEQLTDKIGRQECKAYITETYQNGTSGYNIWSNGYCEQWGRTGSFTSEVLVTFVKKFANTNYLPLAIQGTANNSDWDILYILPSDMTANTMKIHNGNKSGSRIAYWRACGYLAKDQY